jgi:hypothetical protein
MFMKTNLLIFSCGFIYSLVCGSAAGMLGQYNVGNCKSDILHPKMNGQQRRYFIAAEKILWDYGPLGYDKFSGLPLNASRR